MHMIEYARVNRGLAWVVFAAVMYLILTGAAQHWITLPGLGNIGFTLVFVLFATIHCAACAGWKITGTFLAQAASVSYLMEEVGVRTGWIYGAYHYSEMLGPKLGHGDGPRYGGKRQLGMGARRFLFWRAAPKLTGLAAHDVSGVSFLVYLGAGLLWRSRSWCTPSTPFRT
jgi:hypothetical protein